MGVRNVLQKVDMLGPGFSLNVGGSEKLKSTAGSVLTLCYFGSTIAALAYFIIKFFDHSSPTVNEQNDYNKAGKTVPIGNLSYFPMLFVRNAFQSIVKVENAMLAIDPYINHFLKPEGGKQTQKKYSALPCRDVRSNSSLLDYFSDSDDFKLYEDLIIENGICIAIPKKDQSSIESLPPNEKQKQFNDTSKFSSIDLVIDPCDLNKHSDCLTSHYFGKLDPLGFYDLDFDGGLGKIEVLFPDYGYDPTNFEKPFSKYFDLENSFTISSFEEARTQIDTPLQTSLFDQSQYFGKDVLTYSSISTSSKSFEIRKREANSSMEPILNCKSGNLDPEYYCDTLYSLQFSAQQKEVKIMRKYNQIPDILSGIGGISTILLQFFTYANLGVLLFTQKSILTSKLFPMLPQKKLKAGKKKNKYPEIKVEDENDDQKVQEHNKYWDEVIDDAVDLVERTLDISFLFKELCKVRVLANALLDESQTELSAISSLMMYRKEKKNEEDLGQEDKKVKSGGESYLENKSDIVETKTKKESKLISERKKTAKKKREHMRKVIKRNEAKAKEGGLENPSFEDRVDLYLVNAISELKLQSLSDDSGALFPPSQIKRSSNGSIRLNGQAGNIELLDSERRVFNEPLRLDGTKLKDENDQDQNIDNNDGNLYSLGMDEEIQINPTITNPSHLPKH